MAEARLQPRLAVLIAFLLLCAMGGGTARWDTMSLLYVRPAALLTIGLCLILPGRWDFRGLHVPLLLLALFATSMVVQLVPLPPGLWTTLSGRAPYKEAAVIAGLPQPWRPISLMPTRTVNSLLGMLPAFAALVAIAGISREKWRIIADALLIICCLSAILGTLQFASGALYLYTPSDEGLPIGLLSNRNHQALLLTIGILLLAQWGVRRGWSHRSSHIRLGMALAGILYFVTAILLTGSRTGLLLAFIALTAIILMALIILMRGRQRRSARILPLLLLILSPLVMLGFAAYMAQDSGFVRLSRSAGRIGEDLRFLALPTTRTMAEYYFPWGSGFGTFDRVFMQFEPDNLVKRTFYNRAHSDPLEILVTGGVAPLAIMLVYLVWQLIIGARAFLTERSERYYIRRAAALAILLSLLASIVDYPLRAPLLTVTVVLLYALCSNGRSDPIDTATDTDSAAR